MTYKINVEETVRAIVEARRNDNVKSENSVGAIGARHAELEGEMLRMFLVEENNGTPREDVVKSFLIMTAEIMANICLQEQEANPASETIEEAKERHHECIHATINLFSQFLHDIMYIIHDEGEGKLKGEPVRRSNVGDA